MSSASAITSPSTQPPETEPSKRPSWRDHQLAADADRRRAPGADHGGERDAAVLVEPAARGLQHVVRLGAVEGGRGLGHGCLGFLCSCRGQTPMRRDRVARKHKRHRPSPPVPSPVRYIRAGRAPARLRVQARARLLSNRLQDGLARGLPRAVVDRVDLLVGFLRAVPAGDPHGGLPGQLARLVDIAGQVVAGTHQRPEGAEAGGLGVGRLAVPVVARERQGVASPAGRNRHIGARPLDQLGEDRFRHWVLLPSLALTGCAQATRHPHQISFRRCVKAIRLPSRLDFLLFRQ